MSRDARASGPDDGAGRHRRALLLALPALALLLLALLGDLPRLLVTTGTSMLPAFRPGDLAVVLPSEDYAVGDVAAYRSGVLPGTTVLHRVTAVLPGGRLALQGDHNPWVDPEQPVPDAMVGELLVRVPRGGVVLDLLRDPRVLVPGVLALVLLRAARSRAGTTAGPRSARGGDVVSGAPQVDLLPVRRRAVSEVLRAPRRPALVSSLSSSLSSSLPSSLRSSLRPTSALAAARAAPRWAQAAAAVALLGVLALLVVLPAREAPPAVSTVPVAPEAAGADDVRRLGFGYAADVRPSPVYDRPRAQAPLPVFRRLGNRVEVHVDYRGTPGTLRVDAVLSLPNGWRAVAPMTDAEPFTGERHDEVVWLDLDALERRMLAVTEEVGLPADTLRVEVVPTVESEGTRWSPALAFQLDEFQLRLADGPDSLVFYDDGTRGAAREPGSAVPLPLDEQVAPAAAPPSTTTSGQQTGQQGSGAPADRTRLLLLAVALAAGGAVVVVLDRRDRAGPSGGLPSLDHLLLPVAPLPLPDGLPVVEVAELAALVRLAERYGLLVLHWQQDGAEVFVVQDERATYRVRRPAPPSEVADAAAVASDGPAEVVATPAAEDVEEARVALTQPADARAVVPGTAGPVVPAPRASGGTARHRTRSRGRRPQD